MDEESLNWYYEGYMCNQWLAVTMITRYCMFWMYVLSDSQSIVIQLSSRLRFVDVGIIYPILGNIVFQISVTHYENILAHNTALVTRGNSGLPRLNSSRKSSDIPLPTQSPIWVNPMEPITLSFGKKCYNMTTPDDNLQISSTKRAFILTAQDQVTASGIFPWSD